jgi:hypothetical protein
MRVIKKSIDNLLVQSGWLRRTFGFQNHSIHRTTDRLTFLARPRHSAIDVEFFLTLPFAVFIGNIQWAFTERTAAGFLEFTLEFIENSELRFADWLPWYVF